jgi:predicted PurR-regulated permease PerM
MIMGGRSDMHPLLIFFAVLGGLQVFGFLGILLGPLFVTTFLTFLGFFRHEFQQSVAEQKQTG